MAGERADEFLVAPAGLREDRLRRRRPRGRGDVVVRERLARAPERVDRELVPPSVAPAGNVDGLHQIVVQPAARGEESVCRSGVVGVVAAPATPASASAESAAARVTSVRTRVLLSGDADRR
jgi:hypothetical protein